jgi:spoIIIJ-associated protein
MTEKKSKDVQKEIESIVVKLVDLIGVKAEVEITFDKESDVYNVDIKADEEAGLLIGKKGETINAIQLIINSSVRTRLGEWHRVYVNVADFREKEVERLQDLARQTVERAKESGNPQNLYNLTPSQRRTIHIFLSKENGVITESVGEGRERYLTVKVE